MPRILFESDELLVLDKPSGLIAHSDGRTMEPSVAAWLLERYPALLSIGEAWISPQGETIPLAGIVHRLDRTTSGVLMAAKTPGMYAHLKGEFKARRVEKTYLAYVYGHMEGAEGSIIAEIQRTSSPPRRWYARPTNAEDPRAAITEWKLNHTRIDPATAEPVSLLKIRPRTGRTHQIRVHLASIDHAIISDHLYASAMPPLLGFKRPALHAALISLALPGGVRHTFEASLPSDFLAVVT